MERAASVGSLIWKIHPDHHQSHHHLRHHNHHHQPSRPYSNSLSPYIARSTPKLIVSPPDSDVESAEIPLNGFDDDNDNDDKKSDFSSHQSLYDDDNMSDVPMVTKTYKRRFYILLIFSITSFMQYCCWNTFGPISSTCMIAFDWSESEIALMASLDPITYILTVYIFSWVMDVKGMRLGILLTLFFMAFGTGLRCFTTHEDFVTWTIGLGQFFNGLAGPVTQAGPPLISSMWFPTNERTTATAIASLSGSLGIAMAFIIGPLFVKEATLDMNYKEHDLNTTLTNELLDKLQKSLNNFSSKNTKQIAEREFELMKENDIKEKQDSIMLLLYIEFGINALLFICVLVYFPDKPPIPPSYSGHVERKDFKKGLRMLLKNRQYWILCLVYGVTTGVYSGWGAVLNVNLSTFGVTQKEAGWLGFYTVFAGVGAGMLLARYADKFSGRMKILLLLLFIAAGGFFLWFALLCLRIIKYSINSLYMAAIFGGFFISGTIPLFYELSIEQTYPISEGVTTGMLTLVNNIITVMFLVVLIIPGIGTKWMNWVLFSACAVCIPILILVKTNYNRLDVDTDCVNNMVKCNDNNSDQKYDHNNNQSKDIYNFPNQSERRTDENDNDTTIKWSTHHENDANWCFSFIKRRRRNHILKDIPKIIISPSLWSVEEESQTEALTLRLQSPDFSYQNSH